MEPDVTVELVGLLVKHRACDDATLHDLLRTPRMQEHMKLSEQHLRGLGLDGRRRAEVREQQVTALSPYLLSRYDRQKLYDELWTKPARTVAAPYGISDVALGKVCRELRVPKPPRGYWAKKAAGVRVPARPKLPALQEVKRPT